MKSIKKIKNKHYNLLVDKGIIKAIKSLKSYIDSNTEKYKSLILIESSVKDKKRKELQGIIDYEKIVLADNLNRKKLIEIISSLNDSDISNPKKSINRFIDSRDGQEYKTIKINGKTWMAENLNFDVGKGSFCYDNKERNSKRFGRLYTWWSAKDACPPGLRLPSSEEWKELIMYYGGYYENVNLFPERKGANLKGAYNALMNNGKAKFNAKWGGQCYNGKGYEGLNNWGSYLSGTVPLFSYEAIYFHFSGYDKEISRNSRNKYWGYSCRCVRK